MTSRSTRSISVNFREDEIIGELQREDFSGEEALLTIEEIFEQLDSRLKQKSDGQSIS